VRAVASSVRMGPTDRGIETTNRETMSEVAGMSSTGDARAEGGASDVEGSRVIVVIAAYEEAGKIGEVVAGVRSRYPNVVVVDDGSSDGTSRSASEAGATVLRHAVNRGQGAALQTGIDYALAHGAGYIVTFDADGQHEPADIDAMLAPIRAGECEVTLGSRFLGEAVGIPRRRRILLRLAVLFGSAFSGVRLTDAHNGFRAFSRSSAEEIEITLDRMAHASEIVDQVRRHGLAYTEVPVRVSYTASSLGKGQSSRRAVKIALDYLLGKVLR